MSDAINLSGSGGNMRFLKLKNLLHLGGNVGEACLKIHALGELNLQICKMVLKEC